MAGSCSRPARTATRICGASKALPLDREPLEREIDVQVARVGIFSLLPEGVARRFYPDSHFGTETYPDWRR